MIQFCKDLQFFRCTNQKYLVKKGSMSNYSFDIIDEKDTGILNIIFEKTEYPVDENTFRKIVEEYLGDEAEEFIQKLYELEVLKRTDDNASRRLLFIITSDKNRDLLTEKLECMNYEITGFYDLEKLSMPDSVLEENIRKCDILLVFSNTFRPDVFYAVNPYIVANKTKTVIAYMDGEEGIILPLVNPQKHGCYNDFELLRESSFHNLLEYQIMKEEIMKTKPVGITSFQSSMLIDWAMVIMNSICRETYINHFAYSIDFERMHFAKTKLFRFPKCPSCQGDVNMTHPFI